MATRRSMCWLVVGLALGATSCGDSSETSEASGVVTFDGEPVADGQIAFLPDGAGPGGAGAITNGRYRVRAQRGKNRVQITASRMTPLPPGKTGMNGAKQEVRQYVPERYNTKTTLTAEVGGAAKEFPFTLTSK